MIGIVSARRICQSAILANLAKYKGESGLHVEGLVRALTWPEWKEIVNPDVVKELYGVQSGEWLGYGTVLCKVLDEKGFSSKPVLATFLTICGVFIPSTVYDFTSLCRLVEIAAGTD
jgi:hypothetical protein